MRARVRLFALAKDRAGRSEIDLELPEGGTVADLRRALGAASPDLEPLVAGMMITLNAEYAADSDRVPDGAEIAAIPPVSGGTDEGMRP